MRILILLFSLTLVGMAEAKKEKPTRTPVLKKYLDHARAFAKVASVEDVKEILFHKSLQPCMNDLFTTAYRIDRKGHEVGLWVMETEEGGYTCHFWPMIRRKSAAKWDGSFPKGTIFSIHTHPRGRNGKPTLTRSSAHDKELTDAFGVIDLVLTVDRSRIYIEYPKGVQKSGFLAHRRDFLSLKKHALGDIAE